MQRRPNQRPGGLKPPAPRLRKVQERFQFRDRRGDVADLLRAWKGDKNHLLRHYDADGDGEVDVQEWQAAVEDAEGIVDERHAEMRLQPGIHVVRAPRDGKRPLLISNRDPDELARHYRWWSWLHLAVLVGSIVYGLTFWV